MAQNMYRVGDYVYFETFAATPYQIRRIEELNKTATGGAVEAKVTCFFRRRDLPNSLLKIADQAERQCKICIGRLLEDCLKQSALLGKKQKTLMLRVALTLQFLLVSKPRKTLLGKSEPTTSSNANNGESEEPNENGIEPMDVVGETAGKSSTEPPEDKKDSTEEDQPNCSSDGFAGLPAGAEKLDTVQLCELRQHELFLSRIVETLPAPQIRGKCAVVILNEVETCDMYLGRDDSFFYSLVYDPANQTLLADKGRIEIGERHQAEIPEPLVVGNKTADEMETKKERESSDGGRADQTVEEKEEHREEGIHLTEREYVVYHPHHNLTDRDIDQFLIIARAVGTFSRALDSSSSTKLTTLHQTASVASRDITLLHAMALLHQANYDLGQATKFLVPPPDKMHYPLEADKVTSHNTVSLGGPILCRDQLEEWSAAESTLFEDAIEKYGKDFHDIRLDCLPWKSMRDIVEYYYMWKTTSRYSELQKAKHAEQENKLKQVYIPNYNKPNSNLIGSHGLHKTSCESCKVDESNQWYNWGPSHLQFHLCGDCWTVWKKRGGLKQPHEFDTYDLDGAIDGRSTVMNRMGISRNGLSQSALKGVGAQILVGQKGRVAFYLNSALEARIARRMAPKHIFNVRKAARSPFKEVNVKALQEYYFNRPITDVLHTAHQVKRGTVSKWAEVHLIKLHEKRSINAAPGLTQNGGNRKS